jgi:GMP synthase (glutamine-hydrolysing)
MPIAILDYGSQYTKLIARRIRSQNVYCEIFPFDIDRNQISAFHPDGYILSGGPSSVYREKSFTLPDFILSSDKPILGICYGMQLLAHHLGGKVIPSEMQEYGSTKIHIKQDNLLVNAGSLNVWMSHGDIVKSAPEGFSIIAETYSKIIAAISNDEKKYFGLQFHPEVTHTESGDEIIKNFLFKICHAKPDWTPKAIISNIIEKIGDQVGNQRVLAAVSGGVDSTVAIALASRIIKDQIDAVFINTGLLRTNESRLVETALNPFLNKKLHILNDSNQFLMALIGIVDPETKRKIIGETFIRSFEGISKKFGGNRFLMQGTIYPDVIESSSQGESKSTKIKSHHNVGGLPEKVGFELIEPLRNLFKDEVRLIGETLGLPETLVWRQPFPGPGLAVRCLGEVTEIRLNILRKADSIFVDELRRKNWIDCAPNGDNFYVSQAFAVLLPVRSVGVMGDNRTYDETIVLRAVTSEDFMTADWARLPNDFLARISNQIVNSIDGVNRVVFDITSKPPATIEWE